MGQCEIRRAFAGAPHLPALARPRLWPFMRRNKWICVLARYHWVPILVLPPGAGFIEGSPRSSGRLCGPVCCSLRQVSWGTHGCWRGLKKRSRDRLCAERNSYQQFRTKGRTHGLARGIFNRLHADGRLTDRAILNETQFRLDTRWSLGQIRSQDHGDELGFGQDTFVLSQFAQQRKLKVMKQEATLKEAADSRLRRLVAPNQAFRGLEIEVGGSGISYKQIGWKSAHK